MTRTQLIVGAAVLSISSFVLGFAVARPQQPTGKSSDNRSKPLDQVAMRALADSLNKDKPWMNLEDVPENIKAVFKPTAPPQSFESEAAALEFIQYEAARKEFELRLLQFKVGRGTLDVLLSSAKRRMHSQLRLSKAKDERIEFCTAYEDAMDYIWFLLRKRYEVATMSEQDLHQARYAQIEAHLALSQVKAE